MAWPIGAAVDPGAGLQAEAQAEAVASPSLDVFDHGYETRDPGPEIRDPRSEIRDEYIEHPAQAASLRP